MAKEIQGMMKTGQQKRRKTAVIKIQNKAANKKGKKKHKTRWKKAKKLGQKGGKKGHKLGHNRAVQSEEKGW